MPYLDIFFSSSFSVIVNHFLALVESALTDATFGAFFFTFLADFLCLVVFTALVGVVWLATEVSAVTGLATAGLIDVDFAGACTGEVCAGACAEANNTADANIAERINFFIVCFLNC